MNVLGFWNLKEGETRAEVNLRNSSQAQLEGKRWPWLSESQFSYMCKVLD